MLNAYYKANLSFAMEHRVIAHPIVYQGPLLTVYRWDQPLADGTTAVFERCVRPDSVCVLAFLDPETVLLVREKPIEGSHTFLDLPGGRVDQSEEHEAAARRELREETGYEAKRFLLWNQESWSGLQSFKSSLFIATDLKPFVGKQATHDPTEQIEIIRMPFTELKEFCLRQDLRRTQANLAILRLAYDQNAKERLATFLAGS